jgi:hypothetical protein
MHHHLDVPELGEDEGAFLFLASVDDKAVPVLLEGEASVAYFMVISLGQEVASGCIIRPVASAVWIAPSASRSRLQSKARHYC